MQLKLYNPLTRKTEVFTPIDPENKVVTFYSCGPTVYDYAHIGNFRAFLNADVLRRTLEAIGYDVKQVMNITDVGHMTEDNLADGGGEDKMEVATARLIEAKKLGTLRRMWTLIQVIHLQLQNFMRMRLWKMQGRLESELLTM